MSGASDIRAIAYSEASTMSAALALMAKRRNDLDAAMRAALSQQMPMATEGAAEERALRAIAPAPASQQLLDRTV